MQTLSTKSYIERTLSDIYTDRGLSFFGTPACSSILKVARLLPPKEKLSDRDFLFHGVSREGTIRMFPAYDAETLKTAMCYIELQQEALPSMVKSAVLERAEKKKKELVGVLLKEANYYLPLNLDITPLDFHLHPSTEKTAGTNTDDSVVLTPELRTYLMREISKRACFAITPEMYTDLYTDILVKQSASELEEAIYRVDRKAGLPFSAYSFVDTPALMIKRAEAEMHNAEERNASQTQEQIERILRKRKELEKLVSPDIIEDMLKDPQPILNSLPKPVSDKILEILGFGRNIDD